MGPSRDNRLSVSIPRPEGRQTRGTGLLLGALLSALLCLGCEDAGLGSASGSDAADPNEAGIRLSQIRYALRWDLGGIEVEEDGALRFQTDTGLQVHLTEGYVVTYGLSLVPCASEDDPSLAARILGIRSARADHSYDPDPSSLPYGQAESLLDLASRDLGPFDFPSAPYCSFHHLVARGEEATGSLPDDWDMIGTSLHLRGTTWDSDPVDARALAVDATAAYSQWSPLNRWESWELIQQLGAGGALEINLYRNPAHLLNGIDLETASPDEVAWRSLENFVENTRVEFVRPQGS